MGLFLLACLQNQVGKQEVKTETTLRFKRLILSVLVGLFLLLSGQVFAKTLPFAAMNIRWFGTGGEHPDGNRKEYREDTLQKFFKQSKLNDNIVLGFEEIVDVSKLQSLIPEFGCVSYDNSNPGHQHVVLCAKKPYKLVRDGGDDNFALESVTLNMPERLRPVVHAALTDEKGRVLAHFMAVHLKAQPEESNMRMDQVKITSNFIRDNLNDGLPVVIMGDFNTHRAVLTKRSKDDAVEMDAFFGAPGIDMTRNMPEKLNTFCGKKDCAQLDQIWASKNANLSKASTWSVCSSPSDSTKSGFLNRDYYYKNVSDHCPIFSTIEVK